MFLILMISIALGILSTIHAYTFGAENTCENLAVPKAIEGGKTGNWLHGEMEQGAMGEIQEEKKLVPFKVES